MFWAAFVLARPLGAFLDKPLHGRGLVFDRYAVTAVLLSWMAMLIALLPQHRATWPR